MSERNVTRRALLGWIGRSAGSAGVLQAACAMGLIQPLASEDAYRPRPADRGLRVVILGAGIGGLTAAYELDRAGYDVVVLEAAQRAGGRNLTVRGGDRIDEVGSPQTCPFDADPALYLNAGPARIPAVHTALLHYCKELSVRLELFVNDNRNAWVHDEQVAGGAPIRNRQLVNDSRGFIAELASKAAIELDRPATVPEQQRLTAFLSRFGDLDTQLHYGGSVRGGIRSGGITTAPITNDTLDFSQVIRSQFAYLGMNWGEQIYQAGPMLQPVGGMDRIVDAFMREVGRHVRLGAEVRGIQAHDTHVDVTYTAGGAQQSIRADYCFDSLPTHRIPQLAHNLPADYVAALSALPHGKLSKIGLQARDRFWEDEQIYGGISWTSQPIQQIGYPSHGFHDRKGILVGAYVFDDAASEALAQLAPEERIAEAIRQGTRVHPAYAEHVECGVSIAWHRMRHVFGCAARWTDELRARHFETLQRPVGRHYLIGDQVSYAPGWQEGAIRSAQAAMRDLDARRAAG